MKAEMTGKERILAALKRQPVDRLPWVPLLVPYTIAGFPMDAPHHVADAIRYVGADIWTQAVADRYCVWLPQPGNGIIPISYFEKGDHISGYKTPVGTITERLRSGACSSLSAPVKHLIETVADLKVYLYTITHCFPYIADLTEHYEWEMRHIGDGGICADAGIGMTPFKNFIELLAGVENTYYLIEDAPDLFDEVMSVMHGQRKNMIASVAEQSKAEVFVHSENTSWTTMSPLYYEKYCRTQLNDYTSILHAYGKLHVVHMCGKLKFLRDVIANGQFDAVTDIAPAPTGDTELWEAMDDFPDMAVKGGIGCDTFIAENPKSCYNKAVEIIDQCGGRPGVLLGSGDSVPHGTKIDNLRAVSQAIMDYGRY